MKHPLKTASAVAAPPLQLRLYIAGQLPYSVAALENVRRICDAPAFARCKVEIVDVLREPMRSLADGIITTPTLLRVSPGPVVRIFGTLGNVEQVRALVMPQAAKARR